MPSGGVHTIKISVGLKLSHSTPMFIGTSFGTSLLAPKHVGALTEMLIERTIPVIVGLSFWPTGLLPKNISVFTYQLF